ERQPDRHVEVPDEVGEEDHRPGQDADNGQRPAAVVVAQLGRQLADTLPDALGRDEDFHARIVSDPGAGARPFLPWAFFFTLSVPSSASGLLFGKGAPGVPGAAHLFSIPEVTDESNRVPRRHAVGGSRYRSDRRRRQGRQPEEPLPGVRAEVRTAGA